MDMVLLHTAGGSSSLINEKSKKAPVLYMYQPTRNRDHSIVKGSIAESFRTMSKPQTRL